MYTIYVSKIDMSTYLELYTYMGVLVGAQFYGK